MSFYFNGSLQTSNASGLYIASQDDGHPIQLIGPAAGPTSGAVTLTLPNADGTPDQVLKTDGSGNLSWTAAGSGTILGSLGSIDNLLVRTSGTGGSTIQSSGITIDDSDNTSGIGTLGCGAITTTGTLTFDTSIATLTHAANSVADDFTISQTGAQDASLILTSAGTGVDAIALTATAGGISIECADGKEVYIGNGAKDAYVTVAASATAGDEDIRIINTNGTDEAAIALTATAGGIDIDASAGKNITLDGGQILLTSLDNTASAISLTTNQGTSETIVLTNTQGTSNSAITLDASAGGVQALGAFRSNTLVVSVDTTSGNFEPRFYTGSNNLVLFDITAGTGGEEAAIEVMGFNEADNSNGIGQHMHLLFDNDGFATQTVKLNFGTNLLAAGSGLAQYLTFTQTGQSASMVYVGGVWRIINTGASVS